MSINHLRPLLYSQRKFHLAVTVLFITSLFFISSANAETVWSSEAGSFKIVSVGIGGAFNDNFNWQIKLDPAPADCAGGSLWGMHLSIRPSAWSTAYKAEEIKDMILYAQSMDIPLRNIAYTYDSALPCDGPENKALEIHTVHLADQ